jgi:hypothetical protein
MSLPSSSSLRKGEFMQTEVEWRASIEAQIVKIENWASEKITELRNQKYSSTPGPDEHMRQILADNPGISQMAFVKLAGKRPGTAVAFLNDGIAKGWIRLEDGPKMFGKLARLHTLIV